MQNNDLANSNHYTHPRTKLFYGLLISYWIGWCIYCSIQSEHIHNTKESTLLFFAPIIGLTISCYLNCCEASRQRTSTAGPATF